MGKTVRARKQIVVSFPVTKKLLENNKKTGLKKVWNGFISLISLISFIIRQELGVDGLEERREESRDGGN